MKWDETWTGHALIAIEIAPGHQVGSWSLPLCGEHDTVNKVGQLVSLHRPELLQIPWMQTRVPRNHDIAVGQGHRETLLVVRDSDLTLPFLENVPGITYTENDARLRNEDPTTLLAAVVDELVVFNSDKAPHCGLDSAQGLEDHPLSQVKAVDVGEESKSGLRFLRGISEKFEMLSLFSEQGITRNAERVQEKNNLVVEMTECIGLGAINDRKGVVVATIELFHRLPHSQQRTARLHPRIHRHYPLVPPVSNLQDGRAVPLVPKDDVRPGSQLPHELRRDETAAIGEDVIGRLNVGDILTPLGVDRLGDFGGRE